MRTAAACTLGKRKTLFLDAPREGASDPRRNSGALIFRIPISRINWTTSSFLIGTFVLTLTAVPLYLWHFGIDWFQVSVFAVLLAATGFSVTLGYHRLFSHMTFRAKLPVRLFALIFGAAAFENSVLMWASKHRRHHKLSITTKIHTISPRGFFMPTLVGCCSSSGHNHRSITSPI